MDPARCKPWVIQLRDLSHLSSDERGVLLQVVWVQAVTEQKARGLAGQVSSPTARVADQRNDSRSPRRRRTNSSLPPSQGKKPNRGAKPKCKGPRKGSLGCKGGGRALAENPDETVIARPVCCAHCQATLGEADRTLVGRHDKVDLPKVRSVVTRVERHEGHCRRCGKDTLPPVPEGL